MISDPKAKQWCNQAAKGDLEAGSSLLREFYKPIFAYLRRLSGNGDDAADLTQATFSKVWNSVTRFRGGSSVSTWIHRIAYFTYVDWVRRARPSTEQHDSWWRGIPASDPTPLERAEELETRRRVYAAVDKLAEEQRQGIHLHYYQGLSLTDTAEGLGIPESTLKYRLRNALEQLRKDLREPLSI